MAKFIMGLLYFAGLVILLTLLLSACTTQKIVREVVVEERVDTIFVEVPEKIDTVKGEPETMGDFGLVFTGTVVDTTEEGRIDTVVVVRFRTQDTVFTVNRMTDTLIVEKVIKDTTAIVTVTEEQSLPEKILSMWWVVVVILVLILLIFIFKK